MAKAIYIFPDTNFFIQCNPPSDLDWSAWRSYDEVQLLVSRPVQAEIDRQKDMGNSRLARRARSASSLFREILGSQQGYVEVHKARPLVRIYLRPDLKYDETLADRLSYGERDDQLIGIAALFVKHTTESDVCILTHDTGPMATAKMIGLEFVEIPESWLLAPQSDEAQKCIARLEAEVTRLRKAEPAVEVHFEDSEAAEQGLEVNLPLFTPLDEQQIATLMERISREFPLETDFGSHRHEMKRGSSHGVLRDTLMPWQVFTPASDEEIARYRDTRYPQWLRDCESFLRSVHERLNANVEWPSVTVRLKNTGSRPADDVLVTFSARGNLKIQVPANEEDRQPKQELVLPSQPLAPKGHSTPTFVGSLAAGFVEGTIKHEPFASLASLHQKIKHDPNCFYYKSKPRSPVDSFSLVCEQWRHGDNEKLFEFTVHGVLAPGNKSGAVEVKVQAANLTNVVIKTVPVRITVKEVAAFSEAEKIVHRIGSA